MMEEEFFATIKLVSGEELISRVSYIPDDDMVIFHDPMKVDHVKTQQKKVRVEGFQLIEWIHSTFDDLFFIPKSQIITMTECDEKIQKFYLSCVSNDKKKKQLASFQSQGKEGNPQKVIPGYLGSVKQTRDMLEKIFKTK
tara:strand:+ start:1326 stop:1745 length:420 start_codon:yes stop_codon:yes gene_type:complete